MLGIILFILVLFCFYYFL